MRRNNVFTGLAIIWTVAFAALSFYWAMGGTMGIRSLGGSIYEMSLNPSPSFVAAVWLTGVVKLLGAVILFMTFKEWKQPYLAKLLYYAVKTAGVLLFVYGLLNFVTIALSAIHVLEFDLDAYATFWRLVFWEPFWMIGGVFYFYSLKKSVR